ncbi:hypothetical protein HPB47_017205 [Ixodes persulcatus]|uniref:Uncharacterized protein n=1 Tax=Ixodes persulcatus TaxID=34615 RepID=A0AC60QNX3_IXOPE|nr:hypothetical protein HPB47_017205 [Ixodes persulcatus]
MRHAGSQKHIQNAKKKRNAEGVLTKDFMVQGTLDFHKNAASLSLQENVTRAETLFALFMVANSLPYTWADVATLTYPHLFPDSQIAKGFQCGRKKISYIISDGLGPYFKEKVVQELVQPEVFYSIMIDETPVPEAKVQQLDVLARYYSVNTQNVVVEHLQSFHLGHATADELFCCVEDALNELPKKNMIFEKFQTLFQSKEPLLHIFYDEMVALVKQVLGRFLRQESFVDLTGLQLTDLDVESFVHWKAKPECTAVCEENLEEMGGNAALANEFELPFSDLTPTEREMLVRTQNSGLALYEGAPDLPPAPRSPPQSDSG